MDDLRPTIASSMTAITEYARRARRRGFLATVLQPLFSALPLETQLHLRETAEGLVARNGDTSEARRRETVLALVLADVTTHGY